MTILNILSRACSDILCSALGFYRTVLSLDHGVAGLFIKRSLPYGFISSGCKFFPSCSAYAQEAIRQYGLMRGIMVSWGRICRCHPWSAGGYDPVDKSQYPSSKIRPLGEFRGFARQKPSSWPPTQ